MSGTNGKRILGLTALVLAACGGSSNEPAPTITTQPAAATAAVGGTATFTAAASGNGIEWQWTRDGAAISGATAATYTTAALTAADDHAKFAATAKNAGGKAATSDAELRVNVVAIATQPSPVNAQSGSNAVFTVAASGSGTLSYQWKRAGTAIPGATAATYTLASALTIDNGSYSVDVTSTISGNAVTVQSDAVTLNVVSLATIGTQPAAHTVLDGAAVSFTVAATGAGTLSYQWQKDGADLAGATSPTLSIAAAHAADIGSYRCNVTNTVAGFGVTKASSAAALHVSIPPAVAAGSNLLVAEGKPATVSVTATVAAGMSAPSYQWKKDGAAIGGATTASYLVTSSAADSDAASYTCTVTSSIDSVPASTTSDPIAVSLVHKPLISGQPAGNTINGGGTHTFTVTATAEDTIGYQWRLNGNAIAGATSSSYAVNNATALDAGDYTCDVFNTRSGVAAVRTSDPATLVVLAPPQITSQPQSQTVIENQSATFTVAASGSSLSYQWYRDDGSSGTLIDGATGTSYTTPAAQIGDSGQKFFVVIDNGHLPVATSNMATLTVNPIPAVFKASTQSIALGEGVVLTYSFGGTASLQENAGTPIAVTSGGSSVVYPEANTTYTLNVTYHGTTLVPLAVTVKTYTPNTYYSANLVNGTVTRHPADNTRSPVIQSPSSTLAVAPGLKPWHLAATPDEKFLYVSNNASGDITGIVAAATGTLAKVAGSPFAITGDSAPWASAVDPSGKHLYVACAGGVRGFDVNASTGVLTRHTALDAEIPGRTKGDILIHPSGKTLYVADNGNNLIKAYAIDASTGALTSIGDAASAGGPIGLTFDRAATLIFARGKNSTPVPGDTHTPQWTFNATIHSFTLNAWTGAITAAQDYAGFDAKQSFTNAALPWVRGDETHHGLTFAKRPGLDILYNAYNGAGVADDAYYYLSAYAVDLAQAKLTGDVTDLDGGGSPYFPFMDPPWNWADSAVMDRGGSLMVLTNNGGWSKSVAYYCDEAGTCSTGHFPGGSTGNPPWFVVTGSLESSSHGVFTGTLQ